MKLPKLSIEEKDLNDTLTKIVHAYNFLLENKLYRITESEQKIIVFYIKEGIDIEKTMQHFKIRKAYYYQLNRKLFNLGWLIKEKDGYKLNENLIEIQKKYKSKTLSLWGEIKIRQKK